MLGIVLGYFGIALAAGIVIRGYGTRIWNRLLYLFAQLAVSCIADIILMAVYFRGSKGTYTAWYWPLEFGILAGYGLGEWRLVLQLGYILSLVIWLVSLWRLYPTPASSSYRDSRVALRQLIRIDFWKEAEA